MRAARFAQILVATLVVALALQTASAQTTFFRPFGSRPVHGQVIDADSHQPIAGAVAQLNTTVLCGLFVEMLGHQTRLDSPPLEAMTDTDGRFTITGLRMFAPCLRADYYERLTVIAPGYLPDFAEENESFVRSSEKSIRSGLFPLQRIRYRNELALLPPPHVATTDGDESGPLWAGTMAMIHKLPPRPLGERGVFATRPGATFSRVAAIARSIIAQDGVTGALSAWNRRGDLLSVSLPVDAGRSLMAGGRDRLVLAGPDTIEVSHGHFPSLAQLNQRSAVRVLSGPVSGAIAEPLSSKLLTLEEGGRRIGIYNVVNREGGLPPEVVPEPPVLVADRFPADTTTIECMGGEAGIQHYHPIIARVGGDLALFLWWSYGSDVRNWKLERISLRGKLPDAIAACATNARDSLYVAPRMGPLIKIDIKREPRYPTYPWFAIVNAPTRTYGLPDFSSLVVDDSIPRDRGELQAVYAVGNNQAVYRFNLDLEPDQRIELLPSSR